MNGFEYDVIRTNPGVDPTLAVWQWEIPLYLFLGGLAGGLMLIAAVTEAWWPNRWSKRLTLWSNTVAFFAISLGMFLLFLDLTHKLYVYRFYLAFRPTAPMSWGSWLLLLAYPAMLLQMARGFSDQQFDALVKRFKPAALLTPVRKWAIGNGGHVLFLAAAAGLGLASYTGFLLQTLVARPFWTSAIIAPLFLSSGTACAAALLVLISREKQQTDGATRWLMGALAAEVVFLTLFLLGKAGGSAIERASGFLVLGGEYTGFFFSIEVVGGLLVPLAMVVWARSKDLSPGKLAPLLVLVGSLSLRFLMVSAGQQSNFTMLYGG